MRLLRTSHAGPTLMVTTITFLLAHSLWPLPQSGVIAFTIFLGQLCVGWTNDLVDVDIDREQKRKNKPLAQGLISSKTVTTATLVALSLCIPLSLFGPLGIRGGAVHLLGVACGVSYNFYFKRTLLSPLPYVVALAALPTSLALSKGHFAPAWLVIVGGLFGLAAHFANVLKDIDEDRLKGIRGLPQVLGTPISQAIAGSTLVFITLVFNTSVNQSWIIPLAVLALIAIIRLPQKYSFWIIMLFGLIDVILLITTGASILSQRS